MIATLEQVKPPSDDKRWRVVETTMRRNDNEGHALIEALHSVQEWFGYIDDDAMQFVAAKLNLPLSKVYGVATFYHFFTLKPKGEHTCVFCNGTACYIKGANQLIDTVKREYQVGPGETTEDGKLSVLTARCLGSCGLAPAVVMDGQVHGNVGDVELVQQLREWVTP